MVETERELVNRMLARSLREGFPAELECPNCRVRGDDVIEWWYAWGNGERGCVCEMCEHEWRVETEEDEG